MRLAVNLFLQAWDRCATYYGLTQGVQEGNPLLPSCMDYWGIGVTVLGAKSAACLCLMYLYGAAALTVCQWGLLLTALSYIVFSFVPWCTLLFLS